MHSKLKKLKIIFFGTSNLAEKTLSHLIKNKLNIVLVITQPDKPAGRNLLSILSPVKKIALENKIPLKEFSKIDAPAINFIKKIQPDLILVCAYGKILPPGIIHLPNFGSINIHPSLLPDLRGPSPIQTALLKGYKKTGLSIIKMDEKMDHGDIVFQEKISIGLNDFYAELENKIIKEINKNIIEILKNWIENKNKTKKQNHSMATFCKLIQKEDGRVDWSRETAEEIYNKFRAFHQWPSTYCFWNKNNQKKKIILRDISFVKSKNPINLTLGQVFKKNNKIFAKTSKNVIEIRRIQIEGKKSMDIESFINGYPLFINSILL